MEYEIMYMDEKTIVGVRTETSNSDLDMPKKIGALWTKLHQEGIYNTIKNKVNERTIGLYSDYENDNYHVTVGTEVSIPENSRLEVKIIPSGKYAKFSVHGHVQHAVAKAWEEIWNMNLDRSFTGDFEEYLNSDIESADIDIYIALK